MPDLGNAWHLPLQPSPRGRGGMLDPVGPIPPGTHVTVISGNQSTGPGGVPGNQLQDGSTVLVRHQDSPTWTAVPLEFLRAEGNDTFFAARFQVPMAASPGDAVEYYLRIAYGDRDTTFVHADGVTVTATTAEEETAQAAPFRFTLASPAQCGRWGQVFPLRNVAIHTTVLPNGLVLMWGRRDDPDGPLDRVRSTPFLWDPSAGDTGAEVGEVPLPDDGAGGTRTNLFCAGHAFLADGRLLVAGGHIADSAGIDTAVLYQPGGADGTTGRLGSWAMTAPMNRGRWYPTATTLPDGSVLVVSGSYSVNGDGQQPFENNRVPQVWKDGTWTSLSALPEGQALELYPRMHVRSDGTVFMSGPLADSWSLALPDGGTWARGPTRDGRRRDYAPSVAYDVDRIVYIGGGTDVEVRRPTAEVEVIDLREAAPRWRDGAPMHAPRRQHNATLLPDGTVLVTGGTRGEGDDSESDRGFNDLRAGRPVHRAELWDPGPDPAPDDGPVGSWTELAAEEVDRCYHSSAVLLPDGRVLSAGGGEFRPRNGVDQPPNDPWDSHRDAQVFSPPYLFRGPRPTIASAPASVTYGELFAVEVDRVDDIGKVTWIRLPSVTHSTDMSQRIDVLDFAVQDGVLAVSAPASPLRCPPGHHMLFVLDRAGVPSKAAIVQIALPADVDLGDRGRQTLALQVPTVTPGAVVTEDTRPAPAPGATRVVVGITGTCPYGIGACWGGADEALRRLEGVRVVDPYPDSATSTAVVHLEDGRLPALDRWQEQFASSANGSYRLRGVEVELTGVVGGAAGALVLDRGDVRPPLRLVPLDPGAVVQWDVSAGSPATAAPEELAAHEQLGAGMTATVTGPLTMEGAEYVLGVRSVSAERP
jgi:galactose oxidase